MPRFARGAAGAFAGIWKVLESRICWMLKPPGLVGEKSCCVGVGGVPWRLAARSVRGSAVVTFAAGRRSSAKTLDRRRVAAGGMST